MQAVLLHPRRGFALLTLAMCSALAACADLTPPPGAGAGASNSTAGSNSAAGGDNRGSSFGGSDAGGTNTAGNVAGGADRGGSGGSASAGTSSAGSGPGGAPSDVGGSSAGSSASGAGVGSQAGGSSGGAAAAGGAGGSVAAGGSAGTGGAPACQSKTSGDIRAWLFQELTATISNELHPFVALTTTGSDVPLAELSIRYYFTGEMSGDWQVDCIWVTSPASGSGLCDAGTQLKVIALDPPRAQADHYLEVSFPDVSGATLSSVPTPVFEARSMFWRAGHPMMNQANDYSFTPTTSEVLSVESRAYKQTSHVTVYRKGLLVWGEEPCP